MTVLEAIQQAVAVEDQVLVGRVRVVDGIQYGVKFLQAVRGADLGNDTNAIVDALIVFGQKLEQIAGAAAPVPPVQ